MNPMHTAVRPRNILHSILDTGSDVRSHFQRRIPKEHVEEEEHSWPENLHPDAAYRWARRLIQQRNRSSIGAFFDRIELLPDYATTDDKPVKATRNTNRCYSISSGSHPPLRICLWMKRNGMVMVCCKRKITSFVRFLNTYEVPLVSLSNCHRFWTTLLERDIGCFPPGLRKRAYQRWRNFNTFPKFLELPPELCENIIRLVVEPPSQAEPYKFGPGSFRIRSDCPQTNLTLVSRQLYNLTAPVIYTQTIFKLSFLNHYDWFVGNLTDASRSEIRSIEISFSYVDMLDFFGLPDPMREGLEVRPAGNQAMVHPRCTELTGLRCLYINFVTLDTSHLWRPALQGALCSWIWSAGEANLPETLDVVHIAQHSPLPLPNRLLLENPQIHGSHPTCRQGAKSRRQLSRSWSPLTFEEGLGYASRVIKQLGY